MFSNGISLVPCWLVFGAVAALAGCGAGHGVPVGQVAARVNKTEVSLHQVQHVLQRQPRLAASRADAPRVVLDSLVEQELAAQAARSEGLESDPAFVQSMELARRELLAGLYQERLAIKATRPSSDEVDQYYDDHAALFAERKLYTLQELVTDPAPEKLVRIRELATSSRSFQELTSGLDQSGVRYRSAMTVQAPENIPLRTLETLARLNQGQSLVVGEGPSVRIWTVLLTQDARIERAAARESIETYLLTERKRKIVASRMQELRKTAKIDYASGFAGPSFSAPAAPSH